MGKKRRFIDKKKAVTFRLVAAKDKDNNDSILMQYVENKNCKLSQKQKNDIIQTFSNQHQFDMRKIPKKDSRYDGIPPEILEQIRNNPDLIINQRDGRQQFDDYSEQDIRIQENDEEDEDSQGEQDAELQEEDDEYLEQNQQDEWVDDDDDDDESQDDSAAEEVRKVSGDKNSPLEADKKPNFTEQDFPQLSKELTQQEKLLNQQKQKLTEQQLLILNSILPENYSEMQIKGVQMKKFDLMGFPIDGRDYSKYISKGGGQIIGAMYSQLPPKVVPDVDYEPNQIPQQAQDLEDCLNDGQGYEELQDDFFIKLISKEGVKIQMKQQKPTKQTVKPSVQNKKKMKPIQQVESEVRELKEKPLDLEDEEQQITDQMIDQAMKNFKQHRQFDCKAQQGIGKRNVQNESDEEEQAQKQFHQLSKKQKLRFMRNHRITEPEKVAEQQLEQKLQTFGNCVKPQEVHLRKIYQKTPLQKDLCMQAALQKQQSSIQESSSQSQPDDIVSYQSKHSTIFTDINYVEQVKAKNSKKPKTVEPSNPQHRQVLKPPSEKRNRNQTKEEKRIRKANLKQFKKNRKQMKKQFAQELKLQKKNMQNNATAPMFGIPRTTII